ncbi:MAG: hypothetical protein OEM02_15975 [Desulfobulbaceae bacterium]|nr:hypothetical protein [Desulfobulbaceae bacterium]
MTKGSLLHDFITLSREQLSKMESAVNRLQDVPSDTGPLNDLYNIILNITNASNTLQQPKLFTTLQNMQSVPVQLRGSHKPVSSDLLQRLNILYDYLKQLIDYLDPDFTLRVSYPEGDPKRSSLISQIYSLSYQTFIASTQKDFIKLLSLLNQLSTSKNKKTIIKDCIVIIDNLYAVASLIQASKLMKFYREWQACLNNYFQSFVDGDHFSEASLIDFVKLFPEVLERVHVDVGGQPEGLVLQEGREEKFIVEPTEIEDLQQEIVTEKGISPAIELSLQQGKDANDEIAVTTSELSTEEPSDELTCIEPELQTEELSDELTGIEPELQAEEPSDELTGIERELQAEEPSDELTGIERELQAEEPSDELTGIERELQAEEPSDELTGIERELQAEEPSDELTGIEPELQAEEPSDELTGIEPELQAEEPSDEVTSMVLHRKIEKDFYVITNDVRSALAIVRHHCESFATRSPDFEEVQNCGENIAALRSAFLACGCHGLARFFTEWIQKINTMGWRINEGRDVDTQFMNEYLNQILALLPEENKTIQTKLEEEIKPNQHDQADDLDNELFRKLSDSVDASMLSIATTELNPFHEILEEMLDSGDGSDNEKEHEKDSLSSIVDELLEPTHEDD